jgi:hypothetical protein
MPESPTFAQPDQNALLLPFAGSRREIAEYEVAARASPPAGRPRSSPRAWTATS